MNSWRKAPGLAPAILPPAILLPSMQSLSMTQNTSAVAGVVLSPKPDVQLRSS